MDVSDDRRVGRSNQATRPWVLLSCSLYTFRFPAIFSLFLFSSAPLAVNPNVFYIKIFIVTTPHPVVYIHTGPPLVLYTLEGRRRFDSFPSGASWWIVSVSSFLFRFQSSLSSYPFIFIFFFAFSASPSGASHFDFALTVCCCYPNLNCVQTATAHKCNVLVSLLANQQLIQLLR